MITEEGYRLKVTAPCYRIYERWAGATRCTFRIEFTDGSRFDMELAWSDAALAQKMHSAALLAAEKKAQRMLDTAALDSRRDTRCYRTSIGTFWLGFDAGPPTWWLPRCKIGRSKDGTFRVMVGWLRCLVYVGYDRPDKTATTEETP